MRISVVAIVTLLLGLQSVATAEVWTTPDGFLSVEAPDVTRFQPAVELPPKFLVLWMSQDETTRLGVLAVPFPPEAILRQSDVERGFADSLKAVVTRLPNKTISGHEVWTMSAKFSGGSAVQAMIMHHGMAYSMFGTGNVVDPDAMGFNKMLDSLTLHQPPSAARNGRADDPMDPNTMNKLAFQIGAVVGVCLLLGLFFFAKTRIGKSQKN